MDKLDKLYYGNNLHYIRKVEIERPDSKYAGTYFATVTFDDDSKALLKWQENDWKIIEGYDAER